jgi:hypothetical protein
MTKRAADAEPIDLEAREERKQILQRQLSAAQKKYDTKVKPAVEELAEITRAELDEVEAKRRWVWVVYNHRYKDIVGVVETEEEARKAMNSQIRGLKFDKVELGWTKKMQDCRDYVDLF